MNEEEKKAIEYWKRDISLYHYNTQLCSEHYAQIILNLIEKQQKEIEHWKAGMKIVERDKNNHIERLEKELEQEKEKNKELEEKCKEVICVPEGTCFLLKPKDVISKDKIKEKIKEREHIIHNAKLKYGQDYDIYDDVIYARQEIELYKELLEEK